MSSIGSFKRRTPKSIQSRRAVKRYGPKVFENTKKTLFLRGQNTSDVVVDAMNDLYCLLVPHAKRLQKRNAFLPFESRENLEFLGFKNDCSLFCFGSDSKKRPHNLTLGRHFDFHVLDMVELGIVAADRLDMSRMKDLPGAQNAASSGGKPVFVFEGSEWASEAFFIRLKNFLLDFFRGVEGSISELVTSGLDRALLFSLRCNDEAIAAGDSVVVAPSSDVKRAHKGKIEGNTVLCMRQYALLKPEVVKDAAAIKLVDIGPNFDFEIRRVSFAEDQDFKQACKLPREALVYLKSLHGGNVSSDALGNLRGQLHVGTQDVSKGLALRKFKAHKRGNRAAAEAAMGGDEEGGSDGAEEATPLEAAFGLKASKKAGARRQRDEEEHEEEAKPRRNRRGAGAAATAEALSYVDM
jgi:ribosome production factor 2